MHKTFLLGVGGHKCGTTWLHDYLSRSPQTKMGIYKEYHILDALMMSDASAFYSRKREAARACLENPEYRFETDAKLWKSLTFLADIEEYFDYFQTLLTRPRFRLTGDITPSYSGLDTAALSLVRRGILRRGMRIRVIFLMRDPVERCWSAVRMRRREMLRTSPGHRFTDTEAEELRELMASRNYVLRTRYDLTLQRLSEVFEPEELYFGFYETLFNDAEVARICDFLGIDFLPPDFEIRKNVSPKNTATLDETTLREAVALYRPTYTAVMNRFGRDHVAEIWPSAAVLDSLPARSGPLAPPVQTPDQKET